MVRKTSTIVSLIALFLSFIVFYKNGQSSLSTKLWMISIILLIISYVKNITIIHVSKKFWFPLVLILCFGLIVRLISITHMPPFVHGDEAAIGLEAKNILKHTYSFNIFRAGWYGYPQLTFLLAAIPMKLFGISLFTLRLSSVLLGVGSIILTYVLVYIFRNKNEAYIAGFLLACAHIHIHFSRTGFHYMQGLFFTELSIVFFLIAHKYRHLLLFVLAGICTGLGFHVYLSARIVIIILLSVILLERTIQQTWAFTKKEILTYLIGIMYGIGPLAYSIWSNVRSSEVYILNNIHHLSSVYHTTDWTSILPQHLLRALSFFIGGKDNSVQYGISASGADEGTMILLVIGLITWMIHQRKKATTNTIDDSSSLFFTTMALWIILVIIIGGVLTIDPPFFPRLLSIIVPIVIFASCGLHAIFQNGLQRYFLPITIALLSIIAVSNINTYFNVYARQIDSSNAIKITELAYVLNAYENRTVILISDPKTIALDHLTIQFLAPNIHGTTVSSFHDPIISNISSSPTIIVVREDDQNNVQQLKTLYPTQIQYPILDSKNHILFYYVVTPSID